MSVVRIGWSGELNDEQKDILNDMMNLMGMQAAVDAGLLPREKVDKESARLEEKYKEFESVRPTDE